MGPFALDFGAVASFAEMGGGLSLKARLLLAESLPVAEGWVVKGLSRENEE
ncbi:hypothetical protein [Brevundimonas faecalis]|uniref:Uncharacterized protein n=1 Tax=Brevundimonas faecalis TaxID=947378 RepID=A0ABV2RCG1_9CAUL